MKIFVKIKGITCDHCREKITKGLKEIKNIKEISFNRNVAALEYDKIINKKEIVEIINDLGYQTSLKMISTNQKSAKKILTLKEFIIISLLLIIVSIILNYGFSINIFNMIPVINSNTTYAMLFLGGLLTSIHCVSMCGAINIFVSSDNKKNYKKPIFYNLGRLTSYTLLGGFIGFLGKVLTINVYIQGIIIIVAAIFMFLMALNMAGLINFKLNIRISKLFNKIKTKGSFTIGLLNGLMPCGPLQAMQIYALGTGSFVYGALSMFLFCLGTIPLMLFVGLITNLLNNNYRNILNKILNVLIIMLSLMMLNRGLLYLGIDFSNIFKPNYDNYLKAQINDGYQVIEFDLNYNGYKDILVQKDIPLKIIINADKNNLTGCNNALKINEFNINKNINVGQNVIEFIPDKEGTFIYTCWMSMLKNNIVVIDSINEFKSSQSSKCEEGENTNEKNQTNTSNYCN